MKIELDKSKAMRLIVTRPVVVITTVHPNGVVNGGAFGAYTNLSPSEIGVAIGKPSDTYQNIKRTKEFVINIPGADLVDSLSIFGSDTGKDVSEVEEAGLTLEEGVNVSIPHIKECPAAVECKYVKEMPINYHGFVVGEVLGGFVEEGMLDDEGHFDVVKAKVMHGTKYPRPVYVLFGETIIGK